LFPQVAFSLVGLEDDDRITAYGLFLEAWTAVSAHIERELEAVAGISSAEYGVLLRLARTPGEHLRMSDLAFGAGLSTSGMTRLVDRLESQGLVERAACPNDRRGLEAVLTAKGRKIVQKALPTHIESIDKHVVGPLGGDLGALERPMRALRDSARGC
jgi:DNA-binding MarR family transcriptional regulator